MKRESMVTPPGRRRGILVLLAVGILGLAGSLWAVPPDIADVKSLDLATALGIALEKNPSIQAAVLRSQQAEERVRQAVASYYPSIDLTGSYSHVKLADSLSSSQFLDLVGAGLGPGISPGIGLPSSASHFFAPSEDYYDLSLAATWVLFDGFQRHFNRLASLIARKESRFALDETRRVLIASVASAYFKAELTRENILINKADEKFNQRLMEEARARYHHGVGSYTDLLNFRVLVNEARSKRIQSEKNYEVVLSGLASLLGLEDGRLPHGVRLAPLGHETPAELTEPDSILQVRYALAHRPDVLQAKASLDRAKARIGAAKASFFPVLRLRGSLDGHRDNSGRLSSDDFGSTIGIQLSYNLFSGGLSKSQVTEAKKAWLEARQTLQQVQNDVASEVRQAVAEVIAAQEALRLQRSNEILVRQNRDLVEKEYKAGQTSLVRVNEAQRNLVQARQRLAAALATLKNAWYQLHAATGKVLVKIPSRTTP